jgi:hypothetical protein
MKQRFTASAILEEGFGAIRQVETITLRTARVLADELDYIHACIGSNRRIPSGRLDGIR